MELIIISIIIVFTILAIYKLIDNHIYIKNHNPYYLEVAQLHKKIYYLEKKLAEFQVEIIDVINEKRNTVTDIKDK